MRRLLILLACLFWLTPAAIAHQFAPALLSLTEVGDGQVEVFWKQPLVRVMGSKLTPVLPSDCTGMEPPTHRREDTGAIATWRIHCPGGLGGKGIAVEGIGESRANVILRLALLDGSSVNAVLTPEANAYAITGRQSWASVFRDYVILGFEHILGGLDHLLFVLGLTLLAASRSRLFWTVTAFTAGHSLTLALAALGHLSLPSEPVEIAIAASIILLAFDLTRAPDKRVLNAASLPLAVGFGLLHGLGFAGALTEVGLPQNAIPAALLAFNVGIELGQIAFILAVLAFGAVFARARVPQVAILRWVPAYVVGVPASYWVIERSVEALGIV